jgi:recombination protein RecT
MVDIQKSKKKSKALSPKTSNIFELIQSRKDTFNELLPRGSSVDRFVSACLIAVKMSTKLQQCKPESILKAMMESARFGLEPNSPLSEAALVPYGQNVQFLIEYRGLLKLAWNSGAVKSIDYDKVCVNDTFVYKKGFNAEFRHEPNFKQTRGDVYAYYAMAVLTNGGNALIVMTKDEIEDHARQYSSASKSKQSPWVTDFDAMAIKTVIRQLLDKKIPKSTEQSAMLMQQAAHMDDIPQETRDKYTEVVAEEPELINTEGDSKQEELEEFQLSMEERE